MVGNINITLPVNDNMTAAPQSSGTPVLGVNTSSVTEGTGGNGSPTANFAGLLQTIVSGLDNGTGNLQGGTFIDAAGKTVSLAELMQGLLINNGAGNTTGTGKKADSGNSVADLLQQMIAQLQASVAQPVVFIAPGQSVNTASSDSSIAAAGIAGSTGTGNSTTALIAALEQALQNSDAAASAGEGVQGTAAQASITDNAANNAGNPTPGAINDMTNGVDGTALSSIAQQNLTDNTANNAGNPTPGAINDITNGADGTALSSIAQQNLTNYAGKQAPDTINAAILNADNKAGNLTLNLINAATLNAANNADKPATNALNAANNAGNPTTNALNAATLNANGVEVTVLSVTAQKNSTNNSENSTDAATLNASVSAQQTQYAENAKPVQETMQVSRLNELSGPILKTLGSGDSNLTIKLSPPDMGTIQIRLKIENGVLTADFKVDSSAVKDMFTTVMPQIKQSIESSGIKTGSFFTDLKEDSFTDGRRQQETNQQQQRQQKEQKSSFFDFFA